MNPIVILQLSDACMSAASDTIKVIEVCLQLRYVRYF